MPKHTFKKEDPKTFHILETGDYLLQVIGAAAKISDGDKTRGCDMLELFVKSVEHGTAFYEKLVFPDEHTDAKTADFLNNKINTFLCSTNLGATEGEQIELTPESVMGLRGWARVKKTDYKGQPKNELHFWYTNKEKLPRVNPTNTAAHATTPREAAPANAAAEEDPWKV